MSTSNNNGSSSIKVDNDGHKTVITRSVNDDEYKTIITEGNELTTLDEAQKIIEEDAESTPTDKEWIRRKNINSKIYQNTPLDRGAVTKPKMTALDKAQKLIEFL